MRVHCQRVCGACLAHVCTHVHGGGHTVSYLSIGSRRSVCVDMCADVCADMCVQLLEHRLAQVKHDELERDKLSQVHDLLLKLHWQHVEDVQLGIR